MTEIMAIGTTQASADIESVAIHIIISTVVGVFCIKNFVVFLNGVNGIPNPKANTESICCVNIPITSGYHIVRNYGSIDISYKNSRPPSIKNDIIRDNHVFRSHKRLSFFIFRKLIPILPTWQTAGTANYKNPIIRHLFDTTIINYQLIEPGSS